MRPNLIIHRIDDEDNFAAIALNDGILESSGEIFNVQEGDSYLTMTRAQVVFAYRCDEGSRDVLWTTVLSSDGEDEIVVTDMHYEDLKSFVDNVFQSVFNVKH